MSANKQLLSMSVRTLAVAFMAAMLLLPQVIFGAAHSALAEDVEYQRLAAGDRYGTAVAISQYAFAEARGVFVVTGEDWPDALSAGPAAATMSAPVLPVQRTALPASVDRELRRLGVRNAYLIGGPAVLDESVADALRARGIEVERVSGRNRYETAARVAERFFPAPEGAYYASGESYADALAGGAAAGTRGWPLLLTPSRQVGSETPSVGSERIALGGPAALSDAVVADLGARRVAGADRFATAAATVLDAFDTSPVVYVATGLNFPDALSGAAAASAQQAPLLLTADRCMSVSVRDALQALGTRLVVVLGGEGAVSEGAARGASCPAQPSLLVYAVSASTAGPGFVPVNDGIAARDLRTGSTTFVVPRSNTQVSLPAVAPDGSRLVYQELVNQEEFADDNGELTKNRWVIRPMPGFSGPVIRTPFLRNTGNGAMLWNSQGTALVVWRETTQEVLLVDPDTGAFNAIPGVRAFSPTFSPAGDRVWLREVGGATFSVDLAGGNRQDAPFTSLGVRWSPRGDQVLVREVGGYSLRSFSESQGFGPPRRFEGADIAPPADVYGATWAPDSASIAFAVLRRSADGAVDSDILVATVEAPASQTTSVVATDEFEAWPSLSGPAVP